MASHYFRPRRGLQATMTSAGTVLKSGELFFEVPTGGVGKGQCRIKMGDGSTAYSSLPYAINLDNYVATGAVSSETVTFTASTSTSNATLLTEIASGKSVANLFGSIKTLLTNLNTSVTELNNDYSSIETSLANCVTVPTVGTAVGSSSKPIYVNSSGVATACSSTVGSSTTPVYMSSGTITSTGIDISNIATKADIVGSLISEIAIGTISLSIYPYTTTTVTHGMSGTPDGVFTQTIGTSSNSGMMAYTITSRVYNMTSTGFTLHVITDKSSASITITLLWMAVILAS